MNARRRTAALFEVLGVSLAGPLAMWELRRLFGVQVTNPLDTLTANITDTSLITASRQIFVLLMFQYGGYFLLIIPLNWWYRRRGPAAYGLTRAGHSWTKLFLAALGTAALSVWPAVSISLVNAIHPSETAPWRQALFDMSWRRWEVWLFTGVMSWALIPVLEELYVRGYCQRRLAEDWGDGPAILGTACLFTFAHTQYLIANAYNLGMILSLLAFAIGSGVVFAWTRSLIPSMLTHAILNFPMKPIWQGVLMTALVIGAIFFWSRGLAIFQQVFSQTAAATCVLLAVLCAGYAILAARDEPWLYVAAIAMVVLALGLEAMDRRRARTLKPA